MISRQLKPWTGLAILLMETTSRTLSRPKKKKRHLIMCQSRFEEIGHRRFGRELGGTLSLRSPRQTQQAKKLFNNNSILHSNNSPDAPLPLQFWNDVFAKNSMHKFAFKNLVFGVLSFCQISFRYLNSSFI